MVMLLGKAKRELELLISGYIREESKCNRQNIPNCINGICFKFFDPISDKLKEFLSSVRKREKKIKPFTDGLDTLKLCLKIINKINVTDTKQI